MPNDFATWYNAFAGNDRLEQQVQSSRSRQNFDELQRYLLAQQLGGGGEASARARPAAKEPVAAVLDAPLADAEFIADYRALAEELGIGVAPIDVERFKGWLTAEGIAVYARADVDEYLHCKYKVPVGNITMEVKWGWRPLREVDRIAGHADAKNGVVQRGAATYAKPIPFPVLRTVKTVRDQFPSAKFFVSDEMHAERIPDPFLLVEIGSEQFVIERWDEPTFREKRV